jgi:hypothetical protein
LPPLIAFFAELGETDAIREGSRHHPESARTIRIDVAIDLRTIRAVRILRAAPRLETL